MSDRIVKPPVRIKGWHAYSMPRARVIEIDFFARPDRDAAWAARARRKLGPMAFNREYGRSFNTPAGSPYFPEFADKPEAYLREWTGRLITGPVLRGWDLGGSHPFMVTGQWSPVQGVLWYYREADLRRTASSSIILHDFRDLGRYLCGQIPYEELEKEQRIGALRWIDREERSGRYGVPIPWFPPGTQFADFCGHEMNKTQSISGKTEAEVFAEVGIHLLRCDTYMLQDHDRVMRFLMSTHPQYRIPRLQIDPACQELVLAFNGGLCYPKKGGDKPLKDGRADDAVDSAKYLAAGVCPIQSVHEMEKLRTSDASRDESDINKRYWGDEDAEEELISLNWGSAASLRWDR